MLWCLNLLGGAKESRTPDLLRARQALYQLSYNPKMVGLIRLELMTPALSRRCSNQLSYRPNLTYTTKNNLLWILANQIISLRRWSSRRFPYGYLVTTSPQSSTPPWWSPSCVRLTTSGEINSHGVTGGVYKARERIHRSILICDY